MNEYEINPDFKRYVDEFCEEYHISIDEALQYHTVRDVEEYYRTIREKKEMHEMETIKKALNIIRDTNEITFEQAEKILETLRNGEEYVENKN